MSMSGNFPAVPVHDLVIHPRDNDLVVGTHGRSIYIASVKELQQLTDTLLAKDIFVFKPEPVKHNKNWGKIYSKWSDPVEKKIVFAFYKKENGISSIKIKTEKDLMLNQFNDTSEAGLNYAEYDLSIDSTVISEYQAEVNENKNLSDEEKENRTCR